MSVTEHFRPSTVPTLQKSRRLDELLTSEKENLEVGGHRGKSTPESLVF